MIRYYRATSDCYLILPVLAPHAVLLPMRGYPDNNMHTGTLQLAYYTVQIALCRAILRDRNSHIIRERGEMMVMNVLELLRTIQVYRLRAFWWASK